MRFIWLLGSHLNTMESYPFFAVSMLAGIGFTMAMFVAGLAYKSPTTLDTAKLGVLIGSTVSGVIGFLVLRSATKLPPSVRAAQEAEAD